MTEPASTLLSHVAGTTPKVVLYSQPGCAPCFAARTWLAGRKVPFTYRDVQADPQAFRELMDLGSRSTPTLVVGTEVMIGFDAARLSELLAAPLPSSSGTHEVEPAAQAQP